MRRRRLLGLGLAVLLGLTGPASAARIEKVIIQTKSGPIEFTAELATTGAEQSKGLMFRTALPELHGMLFDFGQDQPTAFWMKNTLIPLDMIFIDAALTVRYIHAQAVPLSERNITSPVDVRYVLEIIGGDAARLGIAIGDKVERRP